MFSRLTTCAGVKQSVLLAGKYLQRRLSGRKRQLRGFAMTPSVTPSAASQKLMTCWFRNRNFPGGM